MKNLFFLLFAIAAFSSCTHTYYVSSSPHVPLLREKNEVRATGSVGVSDIVNIVQAQAAFAPTSRIGVAGTYMKAEAGRINEGSGGLGEYHDFALGYLQPIHENFVINVFGGYGRGSQWHRYNPIGESDLTFQKLFIQPSIGLTHRNIDLAITPSLSRVHFSQVASNQLDNEVENLALLRIQDHRTFFLFEPAFTVRYGWHYIKLQTQIVHSYNLTHSNLPFEKGQVNIGISFAFAQRMLRKNNPRRGPSPGAKKIDSAR